MVESIKAFVLGIIEGLTEFLPVSSTGHMLLACPLLGIDPDSGADAPFWNSFIYFIQIGAIGAVVFYFWRRLWGLTFHSPNRPWHDHIAIKLMAAFVPSAVVGLLLNDWLEAQLNGPMPVAIALMVGAGLIELVERTFRRPTAVRVEDITLRQAMLIGCFQCLAMIPGTSRSGATIMGGLVVGLSAPVAAEFSFFLAIPTICAAGTYKLLQHHDALTAEHALSLAVGFAASFAVALIVVAAFMRYVQTHGFRVFVIYRLVLGTIVLAWTFWP